MKNIIYANLEDKIVDGIADAVSMNGGLAEIDPLRQDVAPSLDIIQSIAETNTNQKIKIIFAEERKSIKDLLKKTLYDIVKDTGVSVDDIEITEEDVDKVFNILLEGE